MPLALENKCTGFASTFIYQQGTIMWWQHSVPEALSLNNYLLSLSPDCCTSRSSFYLVIWQNSQIVPYYYKKIPFPPPTKMRVNVSHVANWAAAQFICGLLMGRVSLLFLKHLPTKEICGWLYPVAVTSVWRRGNPWCWALLTVLSKVTDLTKIKCRAAANYMYWTKRNHKCLLFWLQFYSALALLSVSIHEQAQVNL